MFVIEAIPLARGVPQGSLSYRSSADFAVGSLISVPLRKRMVLALVTAIAPAVESKAELKRASFMLKGGTLESRGRLPEAFVAAGEKVAGYNAASLGSVFGALLVEALPNTLPQSFPPGPGYQEVFMEETYLGRLEAYEKTMMREKKASRATLIIAPTLAETERLAHSFACHEPILVTGALRGKKREAALAAASAASGLVIATPSFAWTPIERLGAIIVERPSAGGYLTPKRPHLNLAIAAGILAKERGVQLVWGDLPLPIELRPHPALALSVSFSGPLEIVAIEREEGVAFRAVPETLLAPLRAVMKEGGRAAVLGVRRGYAPAVVCRDCGNTLRDARGRALSLTVLGKERLLRSADGETKRDADAVCDVCGSWNLMPLGIGVERLVEELQKEFPEHAMVRFDAESIRTKKAADAALARFAAPGAIAVGTEAMLPYLDPADPVDIGIVASADSLLALPFWRACERAARIGLTLRERAKRTLLATRLPDERAWDAAARPDTTDFFAQESQMREALSYPPFGRLLVFHAEGSKAQLDRAAKEITDALLPLPSARLADRAAPRGRLRLSVIAKIKRGAWPDAALAGRIARLSPGITLVVDAESLW